MAWSAPTEWERWDPEQLLECPYDPVHRIPTKRYQYHVIKCRKQHPEKDFVSCPFNAKHIMLRPELRQHITKCPEKSEVEPYSYKGTETDSDGFYFKGDTSVPSYRKEELSIQPVDEWDRDDEPFVSQYQYSTPPQPMVTPPNVNNQTVLDVLSLKPEDRDKFKNSLRSRAIQNDLESPHYQTGHMDRVPSDIPHTNVNNRSNNVNGYYNNEYSTQPGNNNMPYNGYYNNEYSTTQPGNNMPSNGYHINSTRLPSNVIPTNKHLVNDGNVDQYGTSSYKTSHAESERPQTFRGKGRAKLAEEARRTQFGVTANGSGMIQTCGLGRGRGMLGFSDPQVKR